MAAGGQGQRGQDQRGFLDEWKLLDLTMGADLSGVVVEHVLDDIKFRVKLAPRGKGFHPRP